MILLDSDLLIEVQRGQAKAALWLNGLMEPVALPAPVAWELMFGSRDKNELAKAQRFLSSFDVEPLTSADSTLVEQLIGQYRLSTGLSLPDYLIAAQALNRQATLYTFNLRHYQAISGLDARAPYTR
jgi:predicted nucleic acid-binding protein